MKYYTFDDSIEKIINQTSIINPIINDKLYNSITKCKEKIDKYSYKWNIYKSSFNNYEYIYQSSSSIYNICKLIPVSRSFYKLHEIIKDLNITFENNSQITCIAEGPGGFIQSILHNMRHTNYKINGITLISKSKDIPYWSSLFIDCKNINLLKGLDNTGDICNIDNVNDFIFKIGENKCNFITADGGMDYSNNYNLQETSSYNLIFFEIFIALNIQKKDGIFVLKMFDLLLHKSAQLLYILYQFYDEIIICKPSMSRSTNSEKYIICKGFNLNNKLLEVLKNNLYKLNEFYLELPDKFINTLNKYNDIIINNQIDNIDKIINKIKENKHMYFKADIIQLSVGTDWCEKYNLPINEKRLS